MNTILSLFSGIGGLERGIEAATGARVVCQVERDPFARRILARHWPQAERLDDVAAVGPEWHGVDLVCGGFPCQPHSLAGEREAGDDGRDLWPETARILREVQPKAAIFENVPGLLTSRTDPKNPATKGHFFLKILKDCQKAGYLVRWDCCPASALGAQHRRDRVFIVCTRAATGWPNMSLFPLQEGLFGAAPIDWPRAGAWAGQAYEAHPRWPVTDARWPTPTARDWRSGKHSTATDERNTRPLSEVVWQEEGQPESGGLNPDWTEWLMGVPVGWTLPEGESLRKVFALPLDVEPAIPRVVAPGTRAEGTLRRNRLRCLGNAVVPAVAEDVTRSLFSVF